MSEQLPQLNVTIDGSLSLDELQARQADGFSVLRSAHVGNFMPYNSTLAEAGFPLLLVDHTITGVDTTYLPESIISICETRTVASPGELVCRCMVGTEFLDEVHVAKTRGVFPGTDVFTNTEYLRSNETIAGELVTITATEFPDIFRRKLAMGTIEKIPRISRGNFALDALRIGTLQLADDPRTVEQAVLIPNELDILANFVIEALTTEQEIQYHLSGPAMVEYMKNKDTARTLCDMYAAIKQRASFGSRLPQNLGVALIPTANARFATTKQRSEQITDILSFIDDFEAEQAKLKSERKTFFTSSDTSGSEKKKASLCFNSIEQQFMKESATQIVDLGGKSIFTPVGKGQVTQYDLPNEGGLFVAQENMTLSMDRLAEIAALIKKLIEVPL